MFCVKRPIQPSNRSSNKATKSGTNDYHSDQKNKYQIYSAVYIELKQTNISRKLFLKTTQSEVTTGDICIMNVYTSVCTDNQKEASVYIL